MSEEFNNLMTSDKFDGARIGESIEFIENRLYFMTMSNTEESCTLPSLKNWKLSLNEKSVFYLNVNECLVYNGFYHDFGPLNLSKIYHYINILKAKWKVFKTIVHCTSNSDKEKRTNSALLICAYMIIEENWTAQKACDTLLQDVKYHYMGFRDAANWLYAGITITIEECVNALFKAKWYGFFNMNDFNFEDYEKYSSVMYGNMNWIVPGTLLAFASPHSSDYINSYGEPVHSPPFYYDLFKAKNIKHIVRLNGRETYNAKSTFVADANIQHTDMEFTDGTAPPGSILNNFFSLCEQYIDNGVIVECTDDAITAENSASESIDSNQVILCEAKLPGCKGAVAVHCKAGLGRTGCLIASYIIKHWSFTAGEAIAWTRICRPGSIFGIQQQWLAKKEEHLKLAGEQWRMDKTPNGLKFKRFNNGVYSFKSTSDYITFVYVDPPSPSSLCSYKKSVTSDSERSVLELTKTLVLNNTP